MGVELIHCTPGAERLIVKMARVSNPGNENNIETAPRLLHYLIKNKHWSPFEMASMCVKIDTQRDIAAQILRHRSFSFQEFSTRYAVAQDAAIPDLRRQDMKNRQNSIDDLSPDVTRDLLQRVRLLFGESSKLYNDMLDQGIAKETARRILPLSTQTTLYMHGTLRSWIHYMDVRCDLSTQLEHRKIADEVRRVFVPQFPIIGEALYGIQA
jgi:thymidylate synthase (FAD)